MRYYRTYRTKKPYFIFVEENGNIVTICDRCYDDSNNSEAKADIIKSNQKALIKVLCANKDKPMGFEELETALESEEKEKLLYGNGIQRFVEDFRRVVINKKVTKDSETLRNIIDTTGQKCTLYAIEVDKKGNPLDPKDNDKIGAQENDKNTKNTTSGEHLQEFINTEIDKKFQAFRAQFVNASRNSKIIQIDDNYINSIKEHSDIFGIKRSYMAVDGRAETVMKAVICGASVQNDDIIKTIYESAIKNKGKITFLMAEGGTGKTTILCQTAIYAHKKGIKTLYLNLESQKSNAKEDIEALKSILHNKEEEFDEKKEKTLLIVDSPNADFMDALFKYIAGEHKKLKVLIGDRTENFSSILDETSSSGNWPRSFNPIYLSNSSPVDNNVSIIKRRIGEDATEIKIKDEYKKKIIDNFIDFIQESSKDAYDSHADELQKLEINYRSSVADIIFKIKSIFINDGGSPITQEKWLNMDWDLWKERGENLDSKCKGTVKLSAAFKYVASLGIIGIKMSVETLVNIIGLSDPYDLYSIFPADTFLPVCISEEGIIQLRHDDVAKNFFDINSQLPKTTKQKCLMKMVECNWLSDGDFNQFVQYIFHSARFYDTAFIPDGVDIKEFVEFFDKKLRDKIKKIGKDYSLELSKISLQAMGDKDFDIKKAISDAFNKTIPDDDSKDYTKVWSKFFVKALFDCKEIPDCFLKDKFSEGERKAITSTLEGSSKSGFIRNNDSVNKRFLEWSEILFEKCIQQVPEDEVLFFTLGGIYEEYLEFDKARNVYEQGLQTANNKWNIITKRLASYRHEIDAVNKHRTLNKPTGPIRQAMYGEYEYYIKSFKGKFKELTPDSQEYTEISDHLCILLTKYAHELLNDKQYERAYNLLNEPYISDDSPEAYRKYKVMAYLCQNQYNDRENPYSDHKKAIDYCKKALSYFPDYKTEEDKRKSTVPILLPLMNIYDLDGNKENAVKYALIIKHLDSNNYHARNILKKYDITTEQRKELLEKILNEADD